MVKVGKKANPKLNHKLLNAIQVSGLAVGLLMVAYSAFLYFSNAKSPSPFFNNTTMLISTTAYMLVAIGQAIIKPQTRRGLTVYMILAYIFGALYAVFVMGDTPVVYIFGIILLIATETILGVRAMIVGICYVTILMVCYGLLHPGNDGGLLSSIIISTIMTAVVAIISVKLKSSNLVQVELYERVKDEEQLQGKRLETMMNSLNDTILSVDNGGIIRLYNAAALSLLDTNKDVHGVKVDELFKLTDDDGTSVSLANLIRSAKKVIERNDLSHTYPNGQKINLYLSISPVRGTFGVNNTQSTTGAIVIARDITKQKSLDDERDEFISVVSHELRTPVAIAEGALSNVQLLIDKGGDAKQLDRTLNDAHREVLFLSQMVNDLSTLSRAQNGVGMDPENIDVETFLHELYNKYNDSASEHHLKLELDVHSSGSVNVSRMAVEEVMQNLITNAIKYTNEGSVTIGARQVDGDGRPGVEFFVRDSGIGISKSDQAHIFQRFWRSEDYRTRETSGTGLGLYVVGQLADKMGTKIELASRINHGSTFSFRLPLLAQSTTKN